MTFVVTDNCIKCKYMDCVEVCPVDCFYEGENMLVIHPDECIDCGVCEPECPAEAIFPDTQARPPELAQAECRLCAGLAEHHDQARAACGCEGVRWRAPKVRAVFFVEPRARRLSTMSAAQRRYERYWTPVQFCTDRLQLSAQSKRRSAAFMPLLPEGPANSLRVRSSI